MELSRPISVTTANRFIFSLALLPIIPAATTLAVNFLLDLVQGRPVPFDEFRVWQGLFSFLWTTGLILIWRSAVLWTIGRRRFTWLISAVPFIQVAWAQPLWTLPGCRFFSDGLLMIGQHQISAGLWVWLAVWVWWGTERWMMKARERNGVSQRMGPIGKRLVACLGMVPVVFGIFLIAGVAAEDFLNTAYALHVGMGAAAVAAVVLWSIIWRRVIDWSPTTARALVLSAAVLMGMPIALWAALQQSVRESYSIMLGCLPLIGWGVWMAWVTARCPMRINLDESASSPSCPSCGYSLRGLTTTRCPECGCEPTLDQLWAISA